MTRNAHLTDDQNARLRQIVRTELCSRVPKQVPLAKLLGIAQGNLSKFLDGQLGGSAALALRTAALLNRSVEDVLGAGMPPDLIDEQERRYPSRILAARAACLDGVPLQQIRAVLASALQFDGDPGSERWLKMMNDQQFAKRGNKKDTAWALDQVRPGWPKAAGRRRVERGKSR
ncbi:MAG TPA: hypothetical protein VMI54_05060 [Polyangiaceae bacterium]|nr:hypothetical protein [Polyangiaceae bacterium]